MDLVCRDKTCDVLAFVEVKTRHGVSHGAPSDAVTRDKQRLIATGAHAWLRLLGRDDIVSRFDIVEVLITEGTPKFNLIKDAFRMPEPYR